MPGVGYWSRARARAGARARSRSRAKARSRSRPRSRSWARARPRSRARARPRSRSAGLDLGLDLGLALCPTLELVDYCRRAINLQLQRMHQTTTHTYTHTHRAMKHWGSADIRPFLHFAASKKTNVISYQVILYHIKSYHIIMICVCLPILTAPTYWPLTLAVTLGRSAHGQLPDTTLDHP